MRRALTLALMMLTLMPAPATAAEARARDPEDVQGRLDIVAMRFKGRDGGVGRFEVRTAEEWRCRLLRPTKDTALKWNFDARNDGDVDLVASFSCNNQGELKVAVRGTRSGMRYQPFNARRPDRSSVKFLMPLDIPELRGNHLGLTTQSRDAEARSCLVPCVDRAPELGSLRAY